MIIDMRLYAQRRHAEKWSHEMALELAEIYPDPRPVVISEKPIFKRINADAFSHLMKSLERYRKDVDMQLPKSKTGYCPVCKRKLKTPESIERGIGPKCEQRLLNQKDDQGRQLSLLDVEPTEKDSVQQ
ncbi:DUF6011 domain-containing protein [Staphylococcus aureus]|uniref:DUF6011 domain-containing protein n=1 Tax=Staphylococcus aureus TaxID=1280 RepID=UPI0020BE2827|nr:DUF6011 domain-containing protein [Staphylococcus aureus]